MGSGMRHFSELISGWERDLEHDVWQSLVDFWCKGFFLAYAKVRASNIKCCCHSCPSRKQTCDTMLEHRDILPWACRAFTHKMRV